MKKCAKGWSEYELGLPLSESVSHLIDLEAGYVVEPAPDPTRLLAFGLGGITIREEFVRDTVLGVDQVEGPEDASETRRVVHKDVKINTSDASVIMETD